MTQHTPPAYIDTPDALRQLGDSLKGRPWVALDTEFMREKTYYPKFCLLQVATPDFSACVDPLALTDLEPLTEWLFDPAIVKVVHSGRQDMEIFYHLFGRLPAPLFDTQIAAPLLGLAEQIGYAGLIQHLLGVNLAKTHARTDWSRRPLAPEQLRYAADDVIYLASAYENLVKGIEGLGRTAWLEDDFAELSNPALYENPPELAWQRIGGAQQLKGKGLNVLQALAAWREETARAEDVPRGWIVKDEVLLDLARQQPRNAEALSLTRGLDDKIVRRHGRTLCAVIAEALEKPKLSLELPPRPAKKSAEQEAVLDALGAVVRLRAAQNTLNPVILASRKDLEHLVDGEADARLLHGWRRKMVGDELLGLLRGELGLVIEQGTLRVTAHDSPRTAAAD
ncbi:ribonuclease D [Methylococcus sp. EFPC2]|uniref:ribonuclease D n=1 Tax=Methylococcus sp. EFPC2 TaxID=2812648 RepID=UPI001966D98D|nr:ribonuclease D [Methylococcus sp. EFPC2]QSA97192.1 ribonuclease D [Methylococcus sp. EFPC2]